MMETKNEYLTIPEVVTIVRKRRGLSQSDLAVLAHTNRNTISNLERGNYHITLATLKFILDALDMRVMIVPKENTNG